jgi:hypothetical protein
MMLGRDPVKRRDLATQCVTERDWQAGRAELIVERVVDRPWRLMGAMRASCAIWRAISAASGVRGGRQVHGKEKFYGSIP